MITAFDANWGKTVSDPLGDRPVLDFTVKGPHPEVFAYQLLETDNGPMMRMRLYGGFDFLATSKAVPSVSSDS